jgi:hypothetical protein
MSRGFSDLNSDADALHKLFDAIVAYGSYVRGNGLEGQDSWQIIKKMLYPNLADDYGMCGWDIVSQRKKNVGDCYFFSVGWDIVSQRKKNDDDCKFESLVDIYKYVRDDLGMWGEEDDDEVKGLHNDKPDKGDAWQYYHFQLQMIRIPRLYPCTLRRLIQIAYNVGQYEAVKNNPIYGEDIKEFYHDNNLNKITSYVDIREASDGISEHLKKNGLPKLPEILSSVETKITEFKKDKKEDTQGGGSNLGLDRALCQYHYKKAKYLHLR